MPRSDQATKENKMTHQGIWDQETKNYTIPNCNMKATNYKTSKDRKEVTCGRCKRIQAQFDAACTIVDRRIENQPF